MLPSSVPNRQSTRPPADMAEVDVALRRLLAPMLAESGPITAEQLARMQAQVNGAISTLPRVWVERKGVTVGAATVLAAHLIPQENRRGLRIRVVTTDPVLFIPGR